MHKKLRRDFVPNHGQITAAEPGNDIGPRVHPWGSIGNRIIKYTIQEGSNMTTGKPTPFEDRYFLQEDEIKIKKLRAELDRKREEEFKKKSKETHWMKCPKCGSDLQEINYQNVMIDRCNECKGLWFDHGELEILIRGQSQATKVFFMKIFR
jgi:Zn-finger nucleic acid-binding protein